MKLKLSKDHLPQVGIVAFAACSVHSVGNLLFAKAQHETLLFWLAACLIELCTAWVIWSIVETTRKVTKSNISKQDRRFYSLVLAAFVVLAIPSLSISVAANVKEFNGLLLGLLFPSLCVACAVGAAIPETVGKYEEANRQQAEADRKAAAARRKEKETNRQRAEARRQQAELDRQRLEADAEANRQQAAAKQKMLQIGGIGETLSFYQDHPHGTRAQAAEAGSVSERTIRNRLNALEEMGAIERRRNGDGVRVLWT